VRAKAESAPAKIERKALIISTMGAADSGKNATVAIAKPIKSAKIINTSIAIRAAVSFVICIISPPFMQMF
jgi:hypothetical protein